jgi:ABC-type glycerol-3-phosphate transport system substrate-binding protein
MSIGSSLARGTATVAVFATDKAIRVGHAVASNGNDFFSVLGEDFKAKNAVAAAKRTVDFAAADAYRAQLRAEIAAGTAPAITPAKKAKLATA